MRFTYICRNEACELNGKPRTVTRLYLGQGLYSAADVICVCGDGPQLIAPTARSSAKGVRSGGLALGDAERFTGSARLERDEHTWPR